VGCGLESIWRQALNGAGAPGDIEDPITALTEKVMVVSEPCELVAGRLGGDPDDDELITLDHPFEVAIDRRQVELRDLCTRHLQHLDGAKGPRGSVKSGQDRPPLIRHSHGAILARHPRVANANALA
jgi:hypothetical protein